MKVDFYRHSLGQEEKDKVKECLDSIFLTTGSYVKEFEEKFAAYLGLSNCIGVNSCTAALHLSLLALDIGPGDEVITTPLTFIATANAIIYVGATPVFVDVEVDTGLIDVTKITAAITPKTKAIIPVHLYGQMCDMKAIRVIADKHKLFIIEDCAHSVESVCDGIRPGQLSDMSCFSFYATKNLTSAEGGAVVTNKDALADKVRVLRLHGMSKSAVDRYQGPYQHWDMTELGWKYNMPNIQAALLLPQMGKIEDKWQIRHQLYTLYKKAFLGAPGLKLPVIKEGAKSAYHLFTIWVKEDKRDALLAFLGKQHIGCAVNYRAIHLLSYYQQTFGFKEGVFPVAETIGNQTISLPFWPGLDEQSVSFVADQVVGFLKS